MKYDLLIGVLTYKRADLLALCLRSLRQHTDGQDGVVVAVANNSTDEGYIRQVEDLGAHHGVAVMSFRRNRGTSASWNALARSHDSRAIAILNDDVRVHKGWRYALDRTVTDPAMGAFSFSLHNGANEWALENPPADVGGLRLARYYCPYPHGAFLMMRRDVFDRVGGFDEKFWIGCEEVDFGIRAWQAGYLCCNVGVSGESYKFASHWGSATGWKSREAPPELRAVADRQADYFLEKHGVPHPLPAQFERDLMARMPL